MSDTATAATDRAPSATAANVLTEAAMRLYLMRCVDHVGGQQALARLLSQMLGAPVSQREISQAVNGHRPVSTRVAVALGFYRRVQPRQVLYQQLPQAQR